jgi:glycosyltransferase involved in cell wall biosynthesis
LWLHTQPEHYFNLLIDALNQAGDLEYIAGYMRAGSKEYAQKTPRHSRSVFLRPVPGWEDGDIPGFQKVHLDWKGDVDPLEISAGIIAGYGGRTQRDFIHTLHRRGVPVLMMSDSNIRTQHGRSFRQRMHRRVKKAGLRSIIRDTDCLLTMNSRGVAYWRYFGAPREKIVVCPFFADYSAVDAGRLAERSAVLEEFKIPERRMILTAARLVPLKRISTMIQFFKELQLGKRGWSYVIAGTGPCEAEIRAAAGEELGKSIFLLDFVQPGPLMKLMCHAHIFALTSDYEAHGIVIGEATAAGTPVFASDVCGAAHDLVFEGVSGWRYRNLDLADWKKKLDLVTRDPGRVEGMRGSTRRVFEEWFARTNPVTVVDREVHRLLARKTMGGR